MPTWKFPPKSSPKPAFVENRLARPVHSKRPRIPGYGRAWGDTSASNPDQKTVAHVPQRIPRSTGWETGLDPGREVSASHIRSIQDASSPKSANPVWPGTILTKPGHHQRTSDRKSTRLNS